MTEHLPTYTLTVGAELVSVDLDFAGRYNSTRTNYEACMARPVEALDARIVDVLEGYADMVTYARKLKKLPKAVKAAVVAEWEK